MDVADQGTIFVGLGSVVLRGPMAGTDHVHCGFDFERRSTGWNPGQPGALVTWMTKQR